MCAQAEERRSHVEVCAEGGVMVQQLAKRISKDGGAALIADYGHDGTKSDTFRVRVEKRPHLQNQQAPPLNNFLPCLQNKPQLKESVLT